MPKEVTYGQQVYSETSEDKPRVPQVNVLWGRDGGYVQIVTKATDAEGGRYAGDYDECQSDVSDGFHVDLERGEINKLIRDLRRARDQAFGKDE